MLIGDDSLSVNINIIRKDAGEDEKSINGLIFVFLLYHHDYRDGRRYAGLLVRRRYSGYFNMCAEWSFTPEKMVMLTKLDHWFY
jgi:hypothetical protein